MLRKLAPFLFLISSFFICGKSIAALVDISFQGDISYLDDPNGVLTNHDIAIGDSFLANYTIDSDAVGSFWQYSLIDDQIAVYTINQSSVSVSTNFLNSTQVDPSPSNSSVLIANDATVMTPHGLISGDFWGLETYYSGPSDIGSHLIYFVDLTGTAISNDDYFVNDSTTSWSYGAVTFGNFLSSTEYQTLLFGTQSLPVPLPGAAWLYSVALIGLSSCRLKRVKFQGQ